MKKFFLCLLVLGFTTSLWAQKGLKVGGFLMPQMVFLLNSDDLKLDDDQYRLEPLAGMAGGAILGYNFNDNAGVRLNLIYSLQGGKYSERRDINFRNNYVTRLEYIKIPLMVGGNANYLNRKVIFSLYAGGQVGFLTRAYAYNDNPVFEPPLPENITQFPTTYRSYRWFNFGAVLDVGADVYLTPEAVLNLHLRGDYGLYDSEDKSASFRLTEGGSTQDVDYWTWVRGLDSQADTQGLNIGLMIGITYTFPSN